MSSIGAVWTGNGLTDGTAISSSNVNEPGNHFGDGVTWSAGSGGGITAFKTENDGFRIIAESGGSGRVRANVVSPTGGIRMQAVVTADSTPSAHEAILSVYSTAETTIGTIQLRTDRRLSVYINASIPAAHSPVLAVGDKVLIDAVFALHDLPSTSNGRIFYRAKNLTNPSWNTTGEFFWDSGYALNLGVNNPAALLAGKVSGGSNNIPAPGLLFERVGADTTVVDISHTSEATAKAYLADAPGDPLPTPVLSVTGTVQPSSQGSNNGTITASWPPVAGAHHYEAGIASGNVSSGFTTVSTNATSPYTWTNLGPGVYTIAVRAVPGS